MNIVSQGFFNPYQVEGNRSNFLQNNARVDQQFGQQNFHFNFVRQQALSIFISNIVNQLVSQLTAQLYTNVAHSNPVAGGASAGGDPIFKRPNQPPIVVNSVANTNVNLSSADSVPANNANGRGIGNIQVNKDTGELRGSFSFTNLTGDVTAAHIHAGKSGETGPIILTLEKDMNNPNTYNIPQGSKFEGQNLKDLLAGDTYVNVHTAQNAPGEIRGQIEGLLGTLPPTKQSTFTRIPFGISSDQSVPANNANGSGQGSISVDENSGKLKGTITFSGLTGNSTAVHIHAGEPNKTGPILITLKQDKNDPTTYHIPQDGKLEGQQLIDFLEGNTYINVHTDQNPKGEVRGQIVSQNTFMTH